MAMSEKKKFDKAVSTLLKAEAYCAELLDNGLPIENVLYEAAGSFKKSFRPDIDSTPVRKISLDETVLIKTNRDGLYDKLPEGLFHQPKGNSKTNSVTDMVEEYRRYRQEEKYARKFFQPLEQEFFHYAVMIEQEERHIVSEMLNGSLEKIFSDFWDVKKNIPAELANTLGRIMPWLHQIKGDMALTAKTLGLILNKPVTVNEEFSVKEWRTDNVPELESISLGVNSVSGSGFYDNCVTWTFYIQEVTTDEITQYPPGEPYGRFLKRFEELFIPLEIEVEYDFGIVENKEEISAEAVMGYSLTI
jgi:hypothetical protein